MILITGGAGFIGRHLTAMLALHGYQGIRVLSRSPERLFDGMEGTVRVVLDATERLAATGRIDEDTVAAARERARLGTTLIREAVELVPGDVRDVETLQRALDGAETVVHTVAIIRETEGRTFTDTNVAATDRVIEAMHRAGVRRLLSMGVLGATDDPRLAYGQSRWQAEQAIMQSGLDYTIVKPSLVLGAADTLSVRLIKTLDLSPPFVPLPNGGRTRFQPISVGDLTAILGLCLRDEGTIGQTYELGGPEYVTFGQLLRTFARLLNKRRVFVPVPSALLMLGAIVLSRLLKNPPATPTELRQLDVDNYTSLDAVPRHFGFTPLRLDEYVDYVREIAGRG